MIPATISYVFSLPNPATRLTGNVYFGVGGGAYFLRAAGTSKVSPGGFAMAGYRFADEKTFVELKYHLSGSVSGVGARGLALMLGRAF